MPAVDIEEIVRDGFDSVSGIVKYGREMWEGIDESALLKPQMHQIIRIHEAISNGRKRIVCADSTSGGKTLTACAVKGLFDKKREAEGKQGKTKALVIAPNQAIEAAWSKDEINKYMASLGLPFQDNVQKLDKDNANLDIINNDMILINYDKFSIRDPTTVINKYYRTLMKVMDNIDLVVVDECHNLKNIQSKRTEAFINIVERTKNKNFLMLSATIVPNREKDIGFMLYMFDPGKYKHYATEPFDYSEDRFSVLNAINSGAWFSFSREELKALFDLPELVFGIDELGIDTSYRFEMAKEYVQRYFDEWKKDHTGIRKISELSPILLQSEFDKLLEMIGKIKGLNQGAQVSIFSFFQTGFSKELMEFLKENTNYNVDIIRGDVELGNRIKKAARFNKGEIDVLINSSSTVSESISLISEDRPLYLIFAEPPLVPANYDQTIGRHYRVGQRAPVYVVEMIPFSERLNEMMIVEKRQREENDNIRYRRNWRPGTVFEDKQQIREEKAVAVDRMTKGLSIEDMAAIANMDEGDQTEGGYRSLKSPRGEVKSGESVNQKFNEGLKAVVFHIGKGIESLAESPQAEKLIDSYSMDELDKTSAGDTNRAIRKVIESIEEVIGRKFKNILDWGCGTACLARTLERPIYNLDALQEMLDRGKDECKKLGIYDRLRTKKIDDFFICGDSKEMPFDYSFFDLVSSGYALQYNAQGYQHRRDVEEILLETNRVLKKGGFGIFALPNQATSKEDIETLEKVLLPTYGFEAVYCDYITGHAVNQKTGRKNKVFPGCYLIVYQKKRAVKEKADRDDIFLHSPYKKVGAGGYRKRVVRRANGAKVQYKERKTEADNFMTSDKKNLAGVIKQKLKKK